MSENVLGKYLKSLRKSLHYTQEFVASKLDLSRQAYSHYETGRVIPPNDICIRLASLYHVKAEKLLHLVLSASDINTEEDMDCPEELSDFLDYFEQEDNEKRTHFLNTQEKELLYYFGTLPANDQEDIMDFLKIKFKRVKKLKS